MTAIDWIILALWLGITLSGFWKGAIRLVFGVGGVVAGIVVAVSTGPDLVILLQDHVSPSWLTAPLAYAGPFLACVVLCLIAAWGLDRTIQALHLGWLNRLAGALLAGLAAAIILAIVIITGARYSPTWAEACSRSKIPPQLIRLLDTVPPSTTVDSLP